MRHWFILLAVIIAVTSVIAQESPQPDTVDSYARNPGDIIFELERDGTIPSGAEELFNQPELNFGGDGAQFTNFTTDNPINNFVMGATLTFSPQSESLEYCAIAARTTRQESNRLEDGSNITTIRLESYLAMGVDNDNILFVFEFGEDVTSELVLIEDTVDISQPVHLLAVALNDTLTLFANGVPVLTDYRLSTDAGSFAYLYAGADDDSTCQAQTLFAYSIPDDLVDTCLVSTDGVINRRSGPGTDFAVVTQFTGAETLEAIGQTIGTDGFVWWLLEDETWARDDVVNTQGFCRILPEVTL